MSRSRAGGWCAVLSLTATAGVTGCGFDLLGALPVVDELIADESAANEVVTDPPATATAGLSCEALGLPRTDDHDRLFEALNAYRQANGLPPLAYSKTLETAADDMAADIAERDFFAHVDPDGNTPADRAVMAGFCHEYVGENLASGFLSVAAVMQAWKESPAHNENLLRRDYTYVGLGVVWTLRNGAVWVQEFALDPAVVGLATSRTLGR